MQATVRSFDIATGSGSLFLDDGEVLDFGPEAFSASGLLRLRPGQRVSLVCGDGVVQALRLGSVGAGVEGNP